MPRSPPTSHPVRLRFDEFELDEANASLLRNGKAVALAPTPFSLLCALARQPGALLTKNALLDSVWGHQFVTESVLKTAISDLRLALGDSPREPRFIETVSRRAVVWVAGEPGIGKTTLIEHFVAGLGGIACARGQTSRSRPSCPTSWRVPERSFSTEGTRRPGVQARDGRATVQRHGGDGSGSPAGRTPGLVGQRAGGPREPRVAPVRH